MQNTVLKMSSDKIKKTATKSRMKEHIDFGSFSHNGGGKVKNQKIYISCRRLNKELNY